ncbi:MAG: methyltransferase domain-containing protein, partial [Clostridiales bacterium]|nr:methyltransferase domain-containing protein [Clostridiales bacterium]
TPPPPRTSINDLSALVLKNHDFAAACRIFEDFLQTETPVYQGLHLFFYALALNQLGRFEEALSAHRRAIKLDPALAEPHGQPCAVPFSYDESESPCIGCGCPDGEIVFVARLTARNYAAINPIRVWKKCPECGLVYVSNLPGPHALSEYYRCFYSKLPGAQNPANDEGSQIPKYIKQSQPRVQVITQALGGSPGSILDIGAGKGTFLRVAQECGWRVTGLDSTDNNIARAKELNGVALTKADFFEFSPAELFDAAVMFQVIEHFTNPWQALEKAASLVRPGGVLVVATPFSDSDYVRAKHPIEDFWWLEPAHLCYLDTTCLINRGKLCGLEKLHIFSQLEDSGSLDVYFRKL